MIDNEHERAIEAHAAQWTEMARALGQAGFRVTQDRHYLRACSPMILWDRTGVEVWLSRVAGGWRLSDLGTAHFMAASVCMPAEADHWEMMADCYGLTLDRGYQRDVEDGPDVAARVVGAAHELVAFQISAHAYGLAMRDTHGFT